METKQPDFRAIEGIAVWENVDKKGKKYLSISIPLLQKTFRAFSPKVSPSIR